MVKTFDVMFSHFNRIPACDGQTNILPQYSPRYGYVSRGKNVYPYQK